MRSSVFKIDLLPGQEFSGHSAGEEWNGWACPYFPLDEAMKLVEKSWANKARYDEQADIFVFTFDGEEEIYPAVV